MLFVLNTIKTYKIYHKDYALGIFLVICCGLVPANFTHIIQGNVTDTSAFAR